VRPPGHASLQAVRSRLDRLARRFPGGPEGNRRLTALLGVALAGGIAAELATLGLGLQHTLLVHVGVGVALVPLVLAKLASTGWRLIRYYTRNPGYRREGPPRPWLRALAPLLVLATVALLGSGVGMVLAPHVGLFRALHGASFSLFLLLVGAHALAHLGTPRRFAFADWRARHHGALQRTGLVAAALTAAVALAAVTAEHVEPWAAAFRHGAGG
jgi:hypothetical protein